MKTYISDSLISEALIIMHTMKENNCFDAEQVEKIKTFYGINKKAAIGLANQCDWLETNDDSYALTESGEILLSDFDGSIVRGSLYRRILESYITTCKPIWARKIPYGRNEAFRIMSEEEQICFKKAGLMKSPVSRDEVEWWDSIAEIERQKVDQMKESVGREGEELTIEYEKTRTKVEPVWESINSNLAGYDILSQREENDTRQILIEVKSSNKTIDNASFYISHREWNFASIEYNRSRYLFYLWSLAHDYKLAIIPYSDMMDHIPTDKGLGEWEDVEIPFSAFEDRFFFLT